MVAEQHKAIDEMKKEIKKLKEDAENTQETLERRTERLKKVEEQMAEITEIKDDFGDKLAARLAQIEVDMEQTKGIQEGNIRAVIDGATQKFEELEAKLTNTIAEAQQKLNEVDNKYTEMYQQAKVSFENLDQTHGPKKVCRRYHRMAKMEK